MWACPTWYECHWSAGWYVGLAANAVIALAYLAIAAHIFVGLWRTEQFSKNPLARATGAIFFTCSVGHGILALHLALPWIGIEVASGTALRSAFGEWHMWLWPPVTSAAALTYWSMRSRFPALVRGSAMFEDLRERQRQALEIHDNVVQGIAQAKLCLETDRLEDAQAALDETLGSAKGIITELLGEEGTALALGAGDLRREAPAGDQGGEGDDTVAGSVGR